MMENIHREILSLITRKRSALTLAQIEHGVIGYKSHDISTALFSMTNNGLMTTMQEKGKTYYQITLTGYNELEDLI